MRVALRNESGVTKLQGAKTGVVTVGKVHLREKRASGRGFPSPPPSSAPSPPPDGGVPSPPPDAVGTASPDCGGAEAT